MNELKNKELKNDNTLKEQSVLKISSSSSDIEVGSLKEFI